MSLDILKIINLGENRILPLEMLLRTQTFGLGSNYLVLVVLLLWLINALINILIFRVLGVVCRCAIDFFN